MHLRVRHVVCLAIRLLWPERMVHRACWVHESVCSGVSPSNGRFGWGRGLFPSWGAVRIVVTGLATEDALCQSWHNAALFAFFKALGLVCLLLCICGLQNACGRCTSFTAVMMVLVFWAFATLATHLNRLLIGGPVVTEAPWLIAWRHGVRAAAAAEGPTRICAGAWSCVGALEKFL